jgi:hypothetical protein
MRVRVLCRVPAFINSMATAARVSVTKVEILGVNEARRTLAFNQPPRIASSYSLFDPRMGRGVAGGRQVLHIRDARAEMVHEMGDAEAVFSGTLEFVHGRRSGSVAVETLVTGNLHFSKGTHTHIHMT